MFTDFHLSTREPALNSAAVKGKQGYRLPCAGSFQVHVKYIRVMEQQQLEAGRAMLTYPAAGWFTRCLPCLSGYTQPVICAVQTKRLSGEPTFKPFLK
jgi:hypothetical protein